MKRSFNRIDAPVVYKIRYILTEDITRVVCQLLDPATFYVAANVSKMFRKACAEIRDTRYMVDPPCSKPLSLVADVLLPHASVAQWTWAAATHAMMRSMTPYTTTTEKYTEAITIAIQKNDDFGVAELLYDKLADSDMQFNYAQALFAAAKRGEYPRYMNIRDSKGRHIEKAWLDTLEKNALEGGNADIISSVYADRASNSLLPTFGASAILAKHGHLEAFKQTLASAPLDDHSDAVAAALRGGHVELLDFMATTHHWPPRKMQHAFEHAVFAPSTAAIDWLVKHAIAPDKELTFRPIHGDSFDILVSLNNWGHLRSAIKTTVKYKPLSDISTGKLLDICPRADAAAVLAQCIPFMSTFDLIEKSTLLVHAIKLHRNAAVKILLEHNVPVNATCFDAATYPRRNKLDRLGDKGWYVRTPSEEDELMALLVRHAPPTLRAAKGQPSTTPLQ